MRLANDFRCTYSYDDGKGGGTPLPAPDTQITQGPGEGSTVEGTLWPDGSVREFIDVSMAAIGGEDPFFECKVDGDPFTFCGTGATDGTFLVFEGAGPHTFQIRACSGWTSPGTQSCDATPAMRSFQLVAPSG